MACMTYSCNKCKAVLCNKFSLIEHQNIHSNETPFLCRHCRKCFSLLKDYVTHVKSEHIQECNFKETCSEKSFEAIEATHKEDGESSEEHKSTCEKESSNASAAGSDKNQDYQCAICKISFKSLKTYKIHQRKGHTFPCEKCNKFFSRSAKLSKHVCVIPTLKEELKCSCSKIFLTSQEFKSHIGNKPFSCCRCSMKFNTVTNLIRHIRTHTKQKPYICKDCGRGFSQSAHLRNHSSTHLGISAVKCNECNFSCKTFNGLLKHKKKHKEGQVNDQTYIDGRKISRDKSICPICNKQFLFKRNMGMHMKVHNSKISLCTECGKVFTSKGKLTSHHKACHREPSICKTCGKVFASAVLLTAHEKIHVNKKLFLCNICQKTFSIKNYLVQHMKTHSNKKQISCTKCGKLFKVAVSLKYHSNICSSNDMSTLKK